MRILDKLKKLRRISNEDNTGFKGNVLITKTDKNGMITNRVGHNELSPANKVRAAYLAASYLNQFHSGTMGKVCICGKDGWVRSSGYFNDASQINQRCFVLLDDAPKTDKFINIYNLDGSLSAGNKIIGWFNTAENAGSNPYFGAYDKSFVKAPIINKLKCLEGRGFFDTNKALGEITDAALMPGFGDPTNLTPAYNGFSVWQCLSRTNSVSKMIPPGITGLTSDSEILVLNTDVDIPSYKINITGTGKYENTTYTESELFNGHTGTIYTFKKIDSSRLAVVIDEVLYILVYSEDGSVTQAASIAPFYSGSDYYGLYLTSENDIAYLYLTGTKGYKKINLTDYSVESVDVADQTLLGGLPSTWTIESTFILANGNGEVFVTNKNTKEVIITTDPSDVCGNMIGTFTFPGQGFSLFDSSADTNIMYMAKPENIQDCNIEALRGCYDITNPTTQTAITGLNTNDLVWLSFGQYSNWYNHFPLSAPVTKTEYDTLQFAWYIGHS